MNSYGSLILLLNLIGAYACLTIGRRSWPAAIVLLPAAAIWCAALTIQHWPLLRDPVETTEPFVLSIIITAPLPIIGGAIAVWIRVRSKRLMTRLQQRRCLNCGYDLRATQSMCPECGNPI
jgi:hypothetical protein